MYRTSTQYEHTDNRDDAIEMVEEGRVSADHLLLCCLKYMSNYDKKFINHGRSSRSKICPCPKRGAKKRRYLVDSLDGHRSA